MRFRLLLLLFIILSSLNAQDSLRVFLGDLTTKNRNKIKVIGSNTYNLNVKKITTNKCEFQLYNFDDQVSRFDSLKFIIKTKYLTDAPILDYYVKGELFYLLFHENLIIYSISKQKILEDFILKHRMSKIHQVDNDKIYLSLNFLYHPNDNPNSLSIGYLNKETRQQNVLHLTEYESLVLLGAGVHNITKSKDFFYVSHLNSYKIDVYNNELEKVSTIDDTLAFDGYTLFKYSSEQMYDGKNWFYEIYDIGDYQHPRMIGIQSIQEDTLIVVYKLPSLKDTPKVDRKIMIDMWIKDKSQQWKKNFIAVEKDDIAPYGVNKSIFFQFKGNFTCSNRFSSNNLRCANPKEKICSNYAIYLFPNCAIRWHPVFK